jgi:hypothetical protein
MKGVAMRVVLNTDGQFGENGPRKGAVGEAERIITDEFGDVMLTVFFEGFRGPFWVYLSQVLWPGESAFGGGTTVP